MNNEFLLLLTRPEGVYILVGLVVLAVNVFSFNIYRSLITLVIRKATQRETLIGENVASLYAKYLFCQLMTGSFFRPNLQLFGNPELDPIIAEIKNSTAYAQVSREAAMVRNLPINFVPYLV